MDLNKEVQRTQQTHSKESFMILTQAWTNEPVGYIREPQPNEKSKEANLKECFYPLWTGKY